MLHVPAKRRFLREQSYHNVSCRLLCKNNDLLALGKDVKKKKRQSLREVNQRLTPFQTVVPLALVNYLSAVLVVEAGVSVGNTFEYEIAPLGFCATWCGACRTCAIRVPRPARVVGGAREGQAHEGLRPLARRGVVARQHGERVAAKRQQLAKGLFRGGSTADASNLAPCNVTKMDATRLLGIRQGKHTSGLFSIPLCGIGSIMTVMQSDVWV